MHGESFMQAIYKHIPTLTVGVVLGVFIAVGSSVFAKRDEQAAKALPIEDLRTFTEVFQHIKLSYVEEVEDKKLLEYAIQGMLTGLDPHSNFLNSDEFKELQLGTTGEFGGLGIEIGQENGFIRIISPIDDTPAQRAGLQAGDVIIKLDHKPAKGISLNDAVKIMRGKPGSKIILTVIREGAATPIDVPIVRAIIKIKSVRSRLLEDNYGYVRISHFQSRTGDDASKALKKLIVENKDKKLSGLVLDLRNNPGGLLNAAVSVSDLFLTDGLVVYTEGRVDDSDIKFKARPDDYLNGAPIVVLVNGGSASASEIVAGALQDHKRAVIMGTKTFGKGSVQTILPMNNQSALKLTTARYFTPSGRSIQATGIEPDITLNKVTIASVENEKRRLEEADLAGHLENPAESEGASKADNTDAKDKEAKKDEPLEKQDYALYQALNLLKGLSIIHVNK